MITTRVCTSRGNDGRGRISSRASRIAHHMHKIKMENKNESTAETLRWIVAYSRTIFHYRARNSRPSVDTINDFSTTPPKRLLQGRNIAVRCDCLYSHIGKSYDEIVHHIVHPRLLPSSFFRHEQYLLCAHAATDMDRNEQLKSTREVLHSLYYSSRTLFVAFHLSLHPPINKRDSFECYSPS